MAITETVDLLGKGLYDDIPDVLTLSSIPTASELEYVSAEDFDATMLDKILPIAIKENIDCRKLLEIDYQWVCRCLRLLNYGPYHTANAIFCEKCGTQYGEYRVNLTSIGCKPLPDGFVNDICISRDEFIDFNEDIHIKLPTIQKMINAYKDNAFKDSSGRTKREFARICYMVSAVGTRQMLSPIDIKVIIQNEFSAADYIILRDRVSELTDYGLRAGGSVKCPKCGGDAAFIALIDDKFFRPTLGDLREWKHDRSKGKNKDASRG